MKTKSLPIVVKSATRIDVWGANSIHRHQPTEENQIGQTHLALICDDIVNIVMNSDNEGKAWQKLMKFFVDGQVEIKD